MATTVRLCLQCGLEIAPGAQSCGRCGAVVSVGYPPVTPDDRTLSSATHPGLGGAPPHTPGQTTIPRRPGEIPGNALAPGTLLGSNGRYQIVQFLSKGGFGQAYLATDTRLNRYCVVKRLVLQSEWSDSDRELAAHSFEREARLLVTLNEPGHPNIPEIYDYLAESRCLVMKFIAGRDLAALLQESGGRLPERRALAYVRAACSALVYMHTHVPESVLHRDIKPNNMLLDAADRIWLIDFGLSKSLLPPQAASRLPTGSLGDLSQIGGTPGFTPPEQWRGMAEPRSDVFALGATLHHLLSGYRPPASESTEWLNGRAALPPIRQLIPELMPEVETLIQRAMRYEAHERPSAAEFLAILDELLARPLIPPPPLPQPPPVPDRFIGRIAALERYAAQLAQRRIAVISAAPGMGKTALAAELARRMHDSAAIFWYACSPESGVEHLINDLAAWLAYRDQPELWRQLQVARLTRTPPPAPELCFTALAQALQALDQPALLCFDDAHLLEDDPAASGLFAQLQAVAAGGKALLLLTAQRSPAFLPPGDDQLAGLDRVETQALFERRTLRLHDADADLLVQATGGNVQLLQLACDSLALGGDFDDLRRGFTASADITGYLLKKVDTDLYTEERAVLQAVAILLGEPGTPALLRELLPDTLVQRPLRELCSRGLLIAVEHPNGRRYTQHSILQGFFAGELKQETGRVLHQRAADYFLHTDPDPLPAARHLFESGETRRAAEHATAEATAIIAHGRGRQLDAFLKPIPLDPLPPDLQARIWTARAEAALFRAEFDTARELLDRALELDSARSEDAVQLRAERYRLRAQMAERTGDSPAAEQDCRAGLALLAPLGLPSLHTARLHAQLADVLLRGGNYDAAAAACRAGLRALPPAPAAARERAILLQRLATTDGDRGLYAEAVAGLEQALPIARQSGDPALIAQVLHNLGRYYEPLGRVDAARAMYGESLAIKEAIGDVIGRLTTILSLGILAMESEEYDQARRHFQECRLIGQQRRLPEFVALAQVNEALADQRTGRLGSAWDGLHAALAIYSSLERLPDQADCLYRLGEIALLRGEPAAAAELAEQAIALARRAGSPLFESPALRVLGEARMTLGDDTAAAAALEAAWELQQQIGDLFDQALIQAARARLAHKQYDPGRATLLLRHGLDLAHRTGIGFLIRTLETLQAQIEG